MNKVKVLIEGYAKVKSDGSWLASSTTTLIETDNGLRIIVDPGANRNLLLEKLGEEKLSVSDIDLVFVTHYHLDHVLNLALFLKAKILDGTTIYFHDQEVSHDGKIPGTDIGILLTPGHNQENASLVVKTSEGKVVICADVFWWKESEKQIVDLDYPDEFAIDMEALKESRKKVLEVANYVIPGHGKMFKVER